MAFTACEELHHFACEIFLGQTFLFWTISNQISMAGSREIALTNEPKFINL
jgi:hypothetical protein